MLRAAFQTFLSLRLSDKWRNEELPAMRAWLARSILEEGQLASLGQSGEAVAKTGSRRAGKRG